jgi:hypothetical protein
LTTVFFLELSSKLNLTLTKKVIPSGVAFFFNFLI